MLKVKSQEYAKSEGFAVVTYSSNVRSLVLRCRHGGTPRNTRNLSDIGEQGSNKRKAVRNSMRINCPWVLKAKLDPPYWVVFEIADTHSHAIGRNPLVYHQHRKLNDDDYQKLQEYIAAKARNVVIYEALRDEKSAPKLTMKVSEWQTLYIRLTLFQQVICYRTFRTIVQAYLLNPRQKELLNSLCLWKHADMQLATKVMPIVR
jgi:hypothetical protein